MALTAKPTRREELMRHQMLIRLGVVSAGPFGAGPAASIAAVGPGGEASARGSGSTQVPLRDWLRSLAPFEGTLPVPVVRGRGRL